MENQSICSVAGGGAVTLLSVLVVIELCQSVRGNFVRSQSASKKHCKSQSTPVNYSNEFCE
jgi:hypothetical protein